ncbi:MAG: peptidylprolyl isomerase [Nanoarchaeota archaeon]
MADNKINKNDFIEVEFIGRFETGEVFDSNIKKELEKLNPTQAEKTRPLIFSIGHGMFLEKIDEFLIDKEIGKTYNITLQPEQAFGKRNPALIKLIPLKAFIEQKINPEPGMIFNFDSNIAKIISVSGGRVMADFNNPLAGKTVSYEINVLRKINDLNEKVHSLMEFFFGKSLDFEIDKDNKIIIKSDKKFTKFIELFKDKFKDILGLNMEIKEVSEEILPEKPKPKKPKNTKNSAQ